MRFAILYYIYQNQSFTLPEYKLNSLSTYVNVVSIIQNTVDVIHTIVYIKNEKNNMKKKFIFIRYHDSCVDNKETNPGAHFSSLLINVLCGILSQNRALSSAFKTFSGTFLSPGVNHDVTFAQTFKCLSPISPTSC